MITIATHSGSFHSDDVFAVAALQLLLGVENTTIVRTRDEAVLAAVDYVVDVGGVYDHKQKRYDHHQLGAPVRENGIPYAAFGLVWDHYGEALCESAEVAASIERQLVLPIDAGDNGVSLYTLTHEAVQPFELYQCVRLFSPVWGSTQTHDVGFAAAVSWARTVITQLMEKAKGEAALQAYVAEVYEAAGEKRVLVFDRPVPMAALVPYEDVAVVVCPDDPATNTNWTATCVRKGFDTFEGRVTFPEAWAGLRDAALQEVSQIADAVFCHRARFVFVAQSKESALRAAGMVGE